MVIFCDDNKVSFKQATVTDCDKDNHEMTTMMSMMTMTIMVSQPDNSLYYLYIEICWWR